MLSGLVVITLLTFNPVYSDVLACLLLSSILDDVTKYSIHFC